MYKEWRYTPPIQSPSLSHRMAIKYKMLEKAAVGERFPLSWMVFDGWDFAITEATTAKMKMKDITMSFKVRSSQVSCSLSQDTHTAMHYTQSYVLTGDNGGSEPHH